MACRHADWNRVRTLHIALDQVPLLDELAAAVGTRELAGYQHPPQVADWAVRLLVERNVGGLAGMTRLCTLLQQLHRPAARILLAGFLDARAGLDARSALGIPIPPPPGPHEHLLDYQQRLREIGMLDTEVALEKARQAALRY
jgi:hypothetical protein